MSLKTENIDSSLLQEMFANHFSFFRQKILEETFDGPTGWHVLNLSPCPLREASLLEIPVTEDKVHHLPSLPCSARTHVQRTGPWGHHKEGTINGRGSCARTVWADCRGWVLSDRSRAENILQGRVHFCTPPVGLSSPHCSSHSEP